MEVSLQELIAAYLMWAEDYYRSPHERRVTGTVTNIRHATGELTRALPPEMPAASMTAKHLYRVQQEMVDSGRLCRKVINERIGWAQRMYRWATRPEIDLVPEGVSARLMLLQSLPYGRSKARESEPVESVPLDWVETTCLYASQKLATMIIVQWFTGCRPDEVCRMRRSWIDTSSEKWLYRPREHKTAYLGKDRVIPLGPQSRAALHLWMRWLDTRIERDGRDSDLLFEGTRYRKHPTGRPMQESSYYAAIVKLNKKYGLNYWTPNQIRHSFATRVEREKGEKAAQLLLDHSSPMTTNIYIDPNTQKKIELMEQFG